METFNQYALIEQKKWTDFLKSLDLGEHSFLFPSIPDIHSCKAVGYSLNSDGLGRIYNFNVNKSERKVTINVKNA